MAKSKKRQDGAASAFDAPDNNHEPTPVATSGRDGADTGNYGDRVSMRAYELYLARGGSDGGDFDDWLAAEREIASPPHDDRRD